VLAVTIVSGFAHIGFSFPTKKIPKSLIVEERKAIKHFLSPTRTSLMSVSGGATNERSDSSTSASVWGKALASWGILSVVGVIGNALRRLVPIALEPVLMGDLSIFQWISYVAWVATMIYTEGYKGFQQKFSPLVVKRAFTIEKNPGFLGINYILAGPYSMGLFGATKKRMTISWAISLGVMGLVMAVKRLPYPWRGILDAGVVSGLTYGTLSILVIFVQAMRGRMPTIDPCLPEKAKHEQ